MFRAIVQRFLHHAVDAGAVRVGQVVAGIVGVDADAEAGTACCFPALPFKRRHQTQIVQHRGPQQQRDVAHRANAGFGLFTEGIEAGPEGFVFGQNSLKPA